MLVLHPFFIPFSTLSCSHRCVGDFKTQSLAGVQQFCHSVLLLLWILHLFPLTEWQLWGYRRWQSSAHWWRLHSHYHQCDPLWSGTIQVQCVQQYQLWNQSTGESFHPVWVYDNSAAHLPVIIRLCRNSTCFSRRCGSNGFNEACPKVWAHKPHRL